MNLNTTKTALALMMHSYIRHNSKVNIDMLFISAIYLNFQFAELIQVAKNPALCERFSTILTETINKSIFFSY